MPAADFLIVDDEIRDRKLLSAYYAGTMFDINSGTRASFLTTR